MLLLLCAFTTIDGLSDLQFLEGTWKRENKENYETWRREADGSFKGQSYKMKDQNKVVSEYLMIRKKADQITYTATVLDQNEGKPIDFVLNKAIKGKVSFENLSHDFPKKIRYTPLSKNEIFVEVLGEGDKGFFYKMTLQYK